jgi:hypothetical protein
VVDLIESGEEDLLIGVDGVTWVDVVVSDGGREGMGRVGGIDGEEGKDGGGIEEMFHENGR